MAAEWKERASPGGKNKEVLIPVETQHAAARSKLVLASESSAALFAARLRIARWCNPGWTLFQKPSPASSRTAELLSVRNQSSRPANDAGLEHTMRQPGVSLRAIFTRAARGAALLLDDALFAGVNLERPAACCVLDDYVEGGLTDWGNHQHGRDAACCVSTKGQKIPACLGGIDSIG